MFSLSFLSSLLPSLPHVLYTHPSSRCLISFTAFLPLYHLLPLSAFPPRRPLVIPYPQTGLSIYAFYGIWNSNERLSPSHPEYCNGSHSASASLDTSHINLESRRGTGIDPPLTTDSIINDKLIKNKTDRDGTINDRNVKNELKSLMKWFNLVLSNRKLKSETKMWNIKRGCASSLKGIYREVYFQR